MCFGASQTLIFALLPYLSEKTHISFSTLILGLSLGTLCFLPGTIFWNTKSDEGKTNSSLIMNAFFLSLSLFTIVVMMYAENSILQNVLIFLIGRFIWGLGASGINGLSQHLRLKSSERKIKSVTTNSFILNLGRTLGPSLLLLPLEIKTTVLGFFIFTLIVLALNFLNRSPDSSRVSNIKSPLLNHSKVILPAVILSFMMTLGTGIVHSGLGSFLSHEFQMSGSNASVFTGSLLLSGSVVMMAGHFTAGMIKDTNWKNLVMIGLPTFSAGLLSFHFVTEPAHLFVSVGIICFGIAFLHPGAILLMNQLTPAENQGRALGIMSMVSTMGAAAGGIVLSFSQLHFQTLLTVLALCLFVIGFKITASHKEVVWKA